MKKGSIFPEMGNTNVPYNKNIKYMKQRLLEHKGKKKFFKSTIILGNFNAFFSVTDKRCNTINQLEFFGYNRTLYTQC